MERPHYKFWPQRLPRSITVPATSLWHNLATNAARYPDNAPYILRNVPVAGNGLKALAGIDFSTLWDQP